MKKCWQMFSVSPGSCVGLIISPFVLCCHHSWWQQICHRLLPGFALKHSVKTLFSTSFAQTTYPLLSKPNLICSEVEDLSYMSPPTCAARPGCGIKRTPQKTIKQKKTRNFGSSMNHSGTDWWMKHREYRSNITLQRRYCYYCYYCLCLPVLCRLSWRTGSCRLWLKKRLLYFYRVQFEPLIYFSVTLY